MALFTHMGILLFLRCRDVCLFWNCNIFLSLKLGFNNWLTSSNSWQVFLLICLGFFLESSVLGPKAPSMDTNLRCSRRSPNTSSSANKGVEAERVIQNSDTAVLSGAVAQMLNRQKSVWEREWAREWVWTKHAFTWAKSTFGKACQGRKRRWKTLLTFHKYSECLKAYPAKWEGDFGLQTSWLGLKEPHACDTRRRTRTDTHTSHTYRRVARS